jgi:hypothetical protein
MATETQLVQEHQQTYRSFTRWSFIFAVQVILVLALLAIFRT